jgi:hypothetical protein
MSPSHDAYTKIYAYSKTMLLNELQFHMTHTLNFSEK